LAEELRPACERAGRAGEEPLHILDLCTGSGAIALGLARLLPPGSVRVTGLDIDARAIRLARLNARLNGLQEEHVGFVRGDVLAEEGTEAGEALGRLVGSAHVLTCNPPYISEREWQLPSEEGVAESVRHWEARRALVGPGPEGAGFYTRLAALLPLLRPPPPGLRVRLAAEIGEAQGAVVRRLFGPGARVSPDSAGRDRVVCVP
jgi:release factor glutamine methyltransferase